MADGIEWRWSFLGYGSAEDGRPVQIWFDQLPEEAKDEIRDLLVHLEKMTNRLWRSPEFDPLDGEGGISELRPDNVTVEMDGGLVTLTLRIYGCFSGRSYIFLHGTRKTVSNDKNGKRIARGRLEQLKRGEATVHSFQF